jgi:hypothetical protein
LNTAISVSSSVQLHWDSSMGIAGDVDTRVGNATAKDLESVNAQHIVCRESNGYPHFV